MYSLLVALGVAAAWPDLSSPLSAKAAAPGDAAVIVGIEHYAGVAPIPGTLRNAEDWYSHFTKTLGMPPANVVLLRDSEGTREKIRKYATLAASQTAAGGRLWFVFIGHGAPAQNGKDGLLVGFDVQQDADSLEARSVTQSDLLALLKRGAQASTTLVLDACFSGRTSQGDSLVPGLQPIVAVVGGGGLERTLVLTAARADQFAGPLPGAERPAFSYLVLGGLRGWADANRDGRVTGGELVDYTRATLRALLKDRTQTPESRGDSTLVLAEGVREDSPDVAAIVLAQPKAGSELVFRSDGELRAPETKVSAPPGRRVDLRLEQLLDAALDTEQSKTASALDKAAAWCRLADLREDNPHFTTAQQACDSWRRFAEVVARRERALQEDYQTLATYLRLHHKSVEQKRAAVDAFLNAYRELPSNERVLLATQARAALGKGGAPELPVGARLEVELQNELETDYALDSGYLQLDLGTPTEFAKAPPKGRISVYDGAIEPGSHGFVVSLSIRGLDGPSMLLTCPQSVTLSDLHTTSARLRLLVPDGAETPRVRRTIVRGAKQVEEEVSCRIDTGARPVSTATTRPPVTPPRKR